jgi:hypothetical protein
MATPTIYWYSKLAEYAAKIIPFVASALAFWAWFYNIVAVLIVGSLNKIFNYLAAIDLSNYGNVDFSTWYYIGILNAVFPLTETFAMLSGYFVFWGALITLRWVKSFIPTIAN